MQSLSSIAPEFLPVETESQPRNLQPRQVSLLFARRGRRSAPTDRPRVQAVLPEIFRIEECMRINREIAAAKSYPACRMAWCSEFYRQVPTAGVHSSSK